MKKLLLIGAVLSVFSFVVATMSFGDDMSMSKAQTCLLYTSRCV